MVKLGFIKLNEYIDLKIKNIDKTNINIDNIKLSLLHESLNFSMFFCKNHKIYFFYSKKEDIYTIVTKEDHKTYSKKIADDEIYESMSKNPKIRDIFLSKYSDKIIFQRIFNFYKNIIDNKFVFNINKEYQSILNQLDSNISHTEKISICYNFYLEFNNTSNVYLEQEFSNLSTTEYSLSEIDLKLKSILDKIFKTNDILFLLKNLNMEKVEDIIQKRLMKHRYKLLLNNVISNKYKHLINEESKLILKNLIFNDISIDDIKKEFIFKIAKNKSSDDFYISLKKYYETKVDFSYDTILKKITDNNIKHSVKDNTILAEIENFEQSSFLGSPSWCISYDEYYFKDYKKKLNRIYFLFDFNAIENPQYSMLGITVDALGRIIYSYDKEDYCAMEYTKKNIKVKFSSISIDEINKKVSSAEDIEDNNLCSLLKETYYNLLINDKENNETIVTRILCLFERKKIDEAAGQWLIKNGCMDSIFDINHHDFFYLYSYNITVFKEYSIKIFNLMNDNDKLDFIKKIFNRNSNICYINDFIFDLISILSEKNICSLKKYILSLDFYKRKSIFKDLKVIISHSKFQSDTEFLYHLLNNNCFDLIKTRTIYNIVKTKNKENLIRLIIEKPSVHMIPIFTYAKDSDFSTFNKSFFSNFNENNQIQLFHELFEMNFFCSEKITNDFLEYSKNNDIYFIFEMILTNIKKDPFFTFNFAFLDILFFKKIIKKDNYLKLLSQHITLNNNNLKIGNFIYTDNTLHHIKIISKKSNI